MTIDIMVMYALVGLIAGVLAGLLGVGGGIVIVPMLVFCFVRQGVQPEVMMHLALGTSLASIMFTSISSCLAHHRRAPDLGHQRGEARTRERLVIDDEDLHGVRSRQGKRRVAT